MLDVAPTAPSPSILEGKVVFAPLGPCTAGVLSALVSIPAPGTRMSTSPSVDPVKSIGEVSGLGGLVSQVTTSVVPDVDALHSAIDLSGRTM
jgi:hypothetical protein